LLISISAKTDTVFVDQWTQPGKRFEYLKRRQDCEVLGTQKLEKSPRVWDQQICSSF
jgi:hypothetical protein